MAQARWMRHLAAVRRSTRWASRGLVGARNWAKSLWSWLKRERSSSQRTTVWAVRPWRRAFWEERCLPWGEVGPRLLEPLRREAFCWWGERLGRSGFFESIEVSFVFR